MGGLVQRFAVLANSHPIRAGGGGLNGILWHDSSKVMRELGVAEVVQIEVHVTLQLVNLK